MKFESHFIEDNVWVGAVNCLCAHEWVYFCARFLSCEAPKWHPSEHINSSTRQYTLFHFLHDMMSQRVRIKKTIFTHWHSAALALFTFWWWHHNWLCNAGDDVTVDLATVMPSRENLYIYISLFIVLFMVIFTVGRVRRFSSPVINIFWARTLWSP